MYVCTCVHVTHIYVAIIRKKAINLKGGQREPGKSWMMGHRRGWSEEKNIIIV